jgi:hypothetical protein
VLLARCWPSLDLARPGRHATVQLRPATIVTVLLARCWPSQGSASIVTGEVAPMSLRLRELSLSTRDGKLCTLVTSSSTADSPTVSFAVVSPSPVSVSLADGPWDSVGGSGRDTVSKPCRFTRLT